MLRLLPVLLVALAGADGSAQGEAVRVADARGGLAPTDTTRWMEVPTASGPRVYVDAEVRRPADGIAEVWTWRAYPTPRRARFGEPYDRVLVRDRVFCRDQAAAPLQMVRYLGRANVDSFMYPTSVGPFGWRAGSTAEAVAQLVCDAAGLGPEPVPLAAEPGG